MAKDIEYVANLNLQGNEIKNVVVEVVPEAPTTDSLHKPGRIVSFGGDLYVSNGETFALLGKSGDVSSLATRVTAVEDKNKEQDTAIGKNSTDISNNSTAINGLKGRLDTAESDIDAAESNITALQGRMTTAEGEIDALQTTVGDENSGLVKKVNDNTTAIGTKANADDVYTKGEINTKVSALETSIDKKANSADVYTKTAIDTTFTNYYKKTETYSSEQIDTKISAASTKAYKIKGSVNTFAELPISDQVEGDVWNVLDKFTIDSKPYPAGTNVVWAEGKWDPLGGIVDLSPYALSSSVSDLKTELEGEIAGKVTQSDYNTKMGEIDAELAKKATTEALTTGLAGKVDTSTYSTDKTALQQSIDSKVTANAAVESPGTYPKITFDAKGLVTGGAGLDASDIPTITADKISDFAATVKTVRFKHSYETDQTTINIPHGLNVEWPQVTVYRTTSKAIIYADVVYTDENNIQISGNAPLGNITVVVSP